MDYNHKYSYTNLQSVTFVKRAFVWEDQARKAEIISARASGCSACIQWEEPATCLLYTSYADNLEEIFENREQIEISKYYERIPKPVLCFCERDKSGKQ